MLHYLVILSYSGSHSYLDNETIIGYANNIGIQGAPSEDIFLLSIPFFNTIQVKDRVKPKLSISDKVIANNGIDIGFHLYFDHDQSNIELATMNITSADTEILKNLIITHKNYQITIDQNTKFVPIGTTNQSELKLYTTFYFTIYTNGMQIVDFTLNLSNLTEVKPSDQIKFVYSTKYIQGRPPTPNTNNDYFVDHLLRKYASICSIVQALLFISLVITIYNQMKSEFEHPSTHNEDFDLLMTSDKGWMLLHGDMFYAPQYHFLLANFVSHGMSCLITLISVTFYAYAFNKDHNSTRYIQAFIIAYVFSSIISGWFSSSLSILFSDKKWLRIVLSSVILPFTCYLMILLSINFFTNYSSPYSISLSTVTMLISFICFPCLFISTISGAISYKYNLQRNSFDTALVPRTIPPQPWYLSGFSGCIFITIFVCSSILPELFYLNNFIWLKKPCDSFAGLFISTLTSNIVAACASICFIYFRIHNENYHWQWISFAAPAAAMIPIFIYSLYFYLFKFEIRSYISATVFLTRSLLISLMFGLSYGGIGFISTKNFINFIFSNAKLD